MKQSSLPFVLATTLILAAVQGLGCGSTEEPVEAPVTTAERAMSLGESTPAYSFSGVGADPMPGYEERVGMHLLNRVRLAPETFGIEAFPGRPLRFEPFMAEAGRWQGRHALEESCFCQQDPEEPGPVRSCCAVERDEGVVQCVGPRVDCDDAEATDREARWAFLNLGAADIRNEFYYAGEESSGLGAALILLQQAGAVVTGDLTSLVLSRVQNDGGEAEADFYWTLLSGRSARPASTLTSGIHLQLPGGSPFPEGSTGRADFSVHFSEPSGPGRVQVALGGQCELLNHGGVVSDDEDRFLGATYTTRLDITQGCHRYIFAALDANGFGHTYPEYGSLGVQVDPAGAVVENDDSCPIWTTERPDTSCLLEATECAAGDVRACYTGRDHTAGVGICELGEEACDGGWWSGVCDGEVLPELEERCDDARDNNCNGFLNEGCPGGGAQPDPDSDVGGVGPGADAGAENGEGGSGSRNRDSGGCGCVSVESRTPSTPIALVVALLLGVPACKRRRQV